MVSNIMTFHPLYISTVLMHTGLNEFVFKESMVTDYQLPGFEAGLTSSISFRFNDLPKELQAQITNSCLTDWSYAIFNPTDEDRMGPALPTRSLLKVAHHSTQPNSDVEAERPWNITSLQLVSHDLKRLVDSESRKAFTGCLYVDPVICSRPHSESPDIGARSNANLRKSITVLQSSAPGFGGFKRDLLLMLPNLKVAITSCNGTLFDGNINGFGEEKFFVRVVSEEKLREMMLETIRGLSARCTEKLEHLWYLGVRTIVEMTVAMGSPPMRFEFMCVFLLSKDADPVVLGKYTMHEWSSSVRLRRMVYNKRC